MSDMSWYYASNGQQMGPVTLEVLCARAMAGAVGGRDLVWAEGMADWVEARRVPEVAAAIAARQPAEQYDLGPEPPPAPVAAYAPPAVASPYAAGPYAPQQPVATLGYHRYQAPMQEAAPGGFWIRFVAAIIDGIITAIPNFIIGMISEVVMPTQPLTPGTPPGAPPTPAAIGLVVVLNLLSIVIAWLYEAMFTASSYQATLGKMAVGLKVTDLYGNPISFGRATGRHFAKILSALICMIGYIMAAFDDRKRALHDHCAGTLVVYK